MHDTSHTTSHRHKTHHTDTAHHTHDMSQKCTACHTHTAQSLSCMGFTVNTALPTPDTIAEPTGPQTQIHSQAPTPCTPSPQTPAEHCSRGPHASRQTRTHRQVCSAPRRLPRCACGTWCPQATDMPPSRQHGRGTAGLPAAQVAVGTGVCCCALGHAETAPRWQGPGVEPGSLQPCQGPAHLSGGLKISGAGTRPARLPAWSWALRGVQRGCEVRSGCVGAARAPTGRACSQLDPALGARSADVPPQPQGGPVPHDHPGASLPGQSSEEVEG